MTSTTVPPAAIGDIRKVAEAIAERYPSVPAGETEASIAVLALWALDAIGRGLLSRDEATDVFTPLDVRIGDARSGPQLSEEAHEILLEGQWFHDHDIGWGPDPQRVRQLAFAILRRSA
jgi:hypothetical protein